MNKFQYPALLKPNNEGGFIVSFRDVPEVITEIWSQEGRSFAPLRKTKYRLADSPDEAVKK